MNLDNGKVILEGFRAIGLKDVDKDRLVAASRESSFVAPAVQPVEPVVAPEAQVMDEPVMAQAAVEPVVEAAPAVQPVEPVVEATAEQVQPVDQVLPEANIFDQAAPVVEQPVNTEPVQAAPEVNVFDTPVVSEEVQGGVRPELDTPQSFHAKEEQAVQDTMSEDPALIMLDNLRKVVEDKNLMIKALNEKVAVLTDQLRVSEEAKKILEAQKNAAETTLAEARMAETMAGPTLVYQQNPQNQQAA